MSWPAKFDSVYVAPRHYQVFSTLPAHVPADVSSKLAGVAVVAEPYMPNNRAALVLDGKIVGWIEFEEEQHDT